MINHQLTINNPQQLEQQNSVTSSIPVSIHVCNTLTDKENTPILQRSLTNLSKESIIPEECIKQIIAAVASNNEVKASKILDEYDLNSLAKVRFNYTTTPNKILYKNISLFFFSCFHGCIKMAKSLISNKNVNINEVANCENGTSGRTALHLASSFLHLEIVKLLLEHNADVDIRDEYNDDALEFCLAMGSKNIDRCYQICKLIHHSKQKSNSIEKHYIKTKTSLGMTYLNYFNNKKDFAISSFSLDHNKDITDVEYRSNNSFIQLFLNNIKPYIINDTSAPVAEDLLKMMNRWNKYVIEQGNITLNFKRRELDPMIEKGIDVDVYNDNTFIRPIEIDFQNISLNSQELNIVSCFMMMLNMLNKEKIEIATPKKILDLYQNISLYVLNNFNTWKELLKDYNSDLPNDLSLAAELLAPQKLELMNELIYIVTVYFLLSSARDLTIF